MAALAERSNYAARTLTIMSYNIDLLQQRIAFIERFMELRDAAAVVATAHQIGLRWFLLDPGDQIAWPAGDRPAAGLRVRWVPPLSLLSQALPAPP